MTPGKTKIARRDLIGRKRPSNLGVFIGLKSMLS
jgi:hypothetical protein